MNEREIISQRNRAICDAYFDEAKSYACLSKEYGVSDSSIKKLVSIYKRSPEGATRVRSGCPIDPRSYDKRPLSSEHWIIGLAVHRFLASRDKQVTAASFGRSLKVPMGTQKVNRVMSGTYDLTLAEINALADGMGVSLQHLLGIKE